MLKQHNQQRKKERKKKKNAQIDAGHQTHT
jgi:hypothetical protein